MSKILTLVSCVLSLFVAGCSSVESDAHFTYRKIEPRVYAAELKDRTGYYLIDVRTPGEYNKGHIAGAVNYDYEGSGFDKEIDTLNRNKTVYVYCKSGGRSASAARVMKRKGFTRVYNLHGGFDKWTKEDLPVSK